VAAEAGSQKSGDPPADDLALGLLLEQLSLGTGTCTQEQELFAVGSHLEGAVLNTE